MSGENELKPCFVPSCAKRLEARVEVFCDDGMRYVRCLNCYAQGPESREEKEAVKGWDEVYRKAPPGTEIVPEGTMEALRRATISLGELAGITTLSAYDYAALDACRKVIKAADAHRDRTENTAEEEST